MAVTAIHIFDLPGQLEDLSTLYTDEPVGTPQDFEIEEDPDDDLVDSSDLAATSESDLTDLESLTIWYILRDQLGKEWWQYEIQAIEDVLDEKFPISPGARDLIQSLKLLETGNAFWKEWEVFNWVSQGINGDGVDFVNFAVPEIEQMAEAMLVASFISKARQQVPDLYGEEVLSYIAVTCLEQGIWVLPFPLVIAQDRLSELLKRRDLDIPLNREANIRRGDKPESSAESVQGERYRALVEEIAGAVRESVRELSTYKRVSNT